MATPKQWQDKVIVVTGATGRQGGAVARHLLAANRFPVRVPTRNAASPAARRLAAQGVEVVQASLDDPKSLTAAMTGAYGVYSVQNFWEGGVEKEIHQGKNVADGAKATGVRHFVYGSVGSAARGSGVAIFSRVMDRTVTFKKIPPVVVWLFMGEMRPMFTWFNEVGFRADVAGVRTRFPEVRWKGLEDWLLAEGWDKRGKAVRKAA